MKWTEREIGRSLYVHVFRMKHLVVVPNCCFPGAECDLLIVRDDLRLMDVEIKISRADLKADQHKEKWLKPWDWSANGWQRPPDAERERVSHPQKIWKHYYALPEEIWKDELIADIPKASGILLIRNGGDIRPYLRVHRQAKPNKDAKPITADELQHVARSMSARMWEAYDEVDSEHRNRQRIASEAA